MTQLILAMALLGNPWPQPMATVPRVQHVALPSVGTCAARATTMATRAKRMQPPCQ